MALFNFGKRKDDAAAYDSSRTNAKLQDNIYSIIVLGSGCRGCHDLLSSTEAAVKSMGIAISVEYVTDIQKIMGYGVMSMPALVVNEKVVSVGKVLKPSDIEKLLHKLTDEH